MELHWQSTEYFSSLIYRDRRAYQALELLVDDLHANKERTINKFLCHSGSEDFLWGLVRLLGSHDSRVAGNSAYILGTVAENPAGSYRIIALTLNQSVDAKNILPNLTRMLLIDDSECVMNAAGTMGTMAETPEGREWILNEPCIGETISHITNLLPNGNLWTASNAALVLARLTIAEEGCERLLHHENSDQVLSQLIQSLGVDEAGRGMNAAFAIGRLCDLDAGRSKLLTLPDSERMISLLAKMLSCSDAGASKNSCFALSCLASSKDGLNRILKNVHSEEIVSTLGSLLTSDDSETGWFAAMTLRTLASQPQGCLRLRDNLAVVPALKEVSEQSDVNEDLMAEVTQTLEILKRLEKPPPPVLTVLGANEVEATWEEQITKCGFPIRYHLFEGSRSIYNGKELECTIRNLVPNTTYTIRLKVSTEGDESPFSDPVFAMTEEDLPGPPLNMKALGSTTTLIKVGWEPPSVTNGVLKGYYVYVGDKQVEHTIELVSIITGLQPNGQYEISVCAATSKGKGPKEVISARTTDLGAHAPAKPEVTVRGRNELHVSWKAPETPLGKITHYDVRVNNEVVYSGMDLHTAVRRLKPDTEYTVTVTAITNEGKCESKATKQRTAKDSFEGDRPPLYQTPPKKEEPEAVKKEEPTPQSMQKLQSRRKKEAQSSKSRSASASSQQFNMDDVSTDATISNTPKSRPVSKIKHDDKTTVGENNKREEKTESEASRSSTPSNQSDLSTTKSTYSLKPVLPKPRPPIIRKVRTSIPKAQRPVTEGGDRPVEAAIVRESTTVRSKGGKPLEKKAHTRRESKESIETPKEHEVTPEKPAKREIAQTEDSRLVTRMYSSGQFKLSDSLLPRQNTGMVEFDAPLPQPSQTSGMTPSYVQRANTFIAHHRNRGKEPHLKKVLDNLSQSQQPSPVTSNKCWSPTIPSEYVDMSHNKFIPMQYRTQPNNLPTSLRRNNTVMNPGSASPSFEVQNVGRSKTDVTGLSGQESRPAAVSGLHGLSRSSTTVQYTPINSQRKPRISHSTGGKIKTVSKSADQSPMVLAVNHDSTSPSHQTTWQSAR